MAASARIRRMTAADVAPAAEVLRRGEWGEREAFFAYAVSAPDMTPLVAERGGAIVGTGVPSVHGPVGWVGTIFVTPAARGAGVGRALTEATMAILADAGCRTQVLVATDMGRPVYERLGFETRTFYRTFEREGGAGGADGPGGPDGAEGAARAESAGRADGVDRLGEVRRFTAADIPDAIKLDRDATGEDRRHVIAAAGAVPGGLALRDEDGRLAGFVLRSPFGGGATMASSWAAAARLIDARVRRAAADHLVRVGTPQENAAGIAALEARGWRPAYRPRRMELGPPVDWRPEWIWGQFNMAIG